MLIPNKKKIAVVLSLTAFVVLSVAAYKPTEPRSDYKNLQVLPKDISQDSLKLIMDHFKEALGVKCSFCHAPSKDTAQKWPDFASDDKPEKNVARYMMKMTMGINSTYFNFNNSEKPDTITVIKCMTCHRGSPHPDDAETEHEEGKQGPPPPPNKN